MTDILTLMSDPMPREQKLELALKMARSWMHCVEPRLLDTPNFKRDMEALDAALSAPKAEAVEPVDYQWREGRSTRHAPDEWDWGPWHAGRLPAHVENREYLRYEERALYTSPIPALINEAERFESADWFFRTMDPDDSGDSPAEAIHSGMIGHFVVCKIASSFNGPTRYGFNAPVLDPESDDEEFLHFASEDEAIAAAKSRAAFPSTGGDNGQA